MTAATDRTEQADPFVAQIRHLRIERGWSQSELARRAGVTNQAICSAEAGHNGYTVYTLQRLAAALDLRVCLCPAETAQDRRRRQWREYKARQRRPQAVDDTAEKSSELAVPDPPLRGAA